MEDKVVTTSIKRTKDHNIFKKLSGNREADPKHVKRIIRNMLQVGNLTGEFPIVVNENMEVIDGQHRLEACRELNWPIYYRIQEGLNLDTVRGINQAAQNWSWKDYAHSFASQGKTAYQQFLDLADVYKHQFGIIALYWGLKSDNYKLSSFKSGDLEQIHLGTTRKLLNQLKEVSDALNHGGYTFSQAMYRIMRNPNYDHARMLHKANNHDAEVKRMATVEEYQRFLENLYNYKVSEDNRVRLY